jgi:hypothetical protein
MQPAFATLYEVCEGQYTASYMGLQSTDLFLREVGDVTRHGGSDNERTGLSLLEVVADSLSAVQDTS